MVMPRILQHYQILAPGEGQNKQQDWLAQGHTQYWWLRQAETLRDSDPTGSRHALAVAIMLQDLDTQGPPLSTEDARDRERDYWYEAVLALRNGPMHNYTTWDCRFVNDVADKCPFVYSPKMQAQIERMTFTYLGIRL